jgi:hypothetical protein
MKARIFLPLQTNTKHSPWFLSMQVILPLAAVQFVALLMKENVDSYLLHWNSFLTQDALWVMKQMLTAILPIWIGSSPKCMSI